MKMSLRSLVLLAAAGVLPLSSADLRIGIVGLDTSHCVSWTPYLNDLANPRHIRGARIVAAFKGSSPDVVASHTRVDRFTEQMQEKWKIEVVPSIEELCRKVDAVMLLSGDGRRHLEQARPVIAARRPLFIDKPVASTLWEAMEIYELARRHGVPVFSASGQRVRYRKATETDSAKLGELRGVAVHGAAPLEPHHQDLFWYGIHSTEGLFTVMGPGCERVVRVATEHTDVVVGVWSDGRVGTLRGLRNATSPTDILIYGTKAIVPEPPQHEEGAARLVQTIVHFFQTGKAPVTPEETLEIIAFMEAADASKRRGSREVFLKEVFEAARQGRVLK